MPAKPGAGLGPQDSMPFHLLLHAGLGPPKALCCFNLCLHPGIGAPRHLHSVLCARIGAPCHLCWFLYIGIGLWGTITSPRSPTYRDQVLWPHAASTQACMWGSSSETHAASAEPCVLRSDSVLPSPSPACWDQNLKPPHHLHWAPGGRIGP